MLKRNDELINDTIKHVKFLSGLLGYSDEIKNFMKDNTDGGLKEICERCTIYSSKYFKNSIVHSDKYSKILYHGRSISIDLNPIGLDKPNTESISTMTIFYFNNKKNIVITSHFRDSIYYDVDFKGINIEDLDGNVPIPDLDGNICDKLKINYITESKYENIVKILDSIVSNNLRNDKTAELEYRVYNKLEYKLGFKNTCLTIVNGIDLWLDKGDKLSDLDISYSDYGIIIDGKHIILDNGQKLFEMEMDCNI